MTRQDSVSLMPSMRGRVTIDDVAREARVAKSTVSRALNNPGRLSAATQRHVRDVASRLGYRPQPRSRSGDADRSGTIALVVATLMNPFVYGVIRGAQHEAAARGYRLVLVDVEEDAERETDEVRRLARSVDGIVLAGSRLPARRIRQLRDESEIVVVNRSIAGLSSVVIDPRSGAEAAVDHLASLGHRDLVYAAGPRGSWSNARRWSAISAAAERTGMRVARLGPFPTVLEGGEAAADAVIGAGATAAVAFNDVLAIGMLRRFRRRGVAVPGDLSVIGFDNAYGAELCHPALSTVGAPRDELGRAAVRVLLADHPVSTEHRVVLPAPLILRASTGPAPAAAQLARV